MRIVKETDAIATHHIVKLKQQLAISLIACGLLLLLVIALVLALLSS